MGIDDFNDDDDEIPDIEITDFNDEIEDVELTEFDDMMTY